MSTKHLGGAVVAGVLAAAAPARANPVCVQVDVPGSTYTQAWQVNDAGQLVATSDVGSAVYADGAWTALPAPPAGFSPANVGALAITNDGTIGGNAVADAGGPSLGFFLAGTTYTFFPSPSADFPQVDVRGLNRHGIAALSAGTEDFSSIAFVYNPNGAAPYAPGFTPLAPQHDGEDAFFILPGKINDAGTVVGSAWFSDGVWGFVHDPIAGTTDVFRIGDGPTRARGINELGQIVGAVNGPNGFRGYLRDGTGDHFYDCDALRPTGGGVFFEGINDAGVISGQVFDAAGVDHGLLVYPDAGAALGDLAHALAAAGAGKGVTATLDRAAADVAAGKTAAACGALGAFASQVSAQSGKQLDAGVAASLAGEANAIAASLGCAR